MSLSTEQLTRDVEAPSAVDGRPRATLDRVRAGLSFPPSAAVLGGSLALVDQAVVSLASFLSTVIVGRICGASELGIYALALSVVFLVVAVQDSLVSTPYTVFGNRLRGHARRQYAGSTLVHFGLLAVLAVIGLALLGGLLAAGIGPPRLAPITWVLVGIIACALLRHFARRFAFADHRTASALLLDVTAAAVQLGGILLLTLAGVLSAAAALTVIGTACFLAGLAWMIRNRRRFLVRFRRLGPDFARNWKIGKWILAGRLVSHASAYAPHWVLALLIGTSATGVFAACLTIALLANPLIMGIGNVLGPRAALAFADGGTAAVKRIVCRNMLFLAAAMSAFCVVVLFVGTQLMRLFYDGNEYAGHKAVIVVLALQALVSAVFVVANHGLVTIERPDVNFKTNLFGLVVLLVLAFPLVAGWGILGVAIATLAGNVAGTSVQCYAFFRIAKGSRPAESNP